MVQWQSFYYISHRHSWTFQNMWPASTYLRYLFKVGWGSNTAVPRAIWRRSIFSDANRYVPQSSGHDTDRNTTNAQHLLWSPKNYGACNAIYVSSCWGTCTGPSCKSSFFSHGRTKLQQLAPSENLLAIFLWTAAAQQCSRSSWNSLSSPETTVQTYSDILTLISSVSVNCMPKLFCLVCIRNTGINN